MVRMSAGMYAVFDGTHFNGGCCFDYGNAETSSTDTGPGSMEAIYFGNCNVWGKGSGPGPWVMADLENGLFSGASPGLNAQNPTISHRFISTAVKGEPGRWVIKGGDACAGTLSTFYDGARPSVPGYNPMKKEGSIILGTGGDNSHGAQGTFYEGVMTRRLPRDETEALVQANIVAAKYSAIPWTKRSLAVGQVVTLRVMTPGHTARYIAHLGPTVNTQVITPSSTMATQNLAKWTIVEGLGRSGCYSFESVDTPGSYIRHDAFSLKVHADNGTKEFREDATFCQEPGFGGTGHSFRLWSHPTRYLRHHGHVGYAASNGGREVFDRATSFTDDATFVMGTGFA